MASYTQLSQRYTEPDFESQWYVVPESFLKKFGISSAYVTASGSNLFTIASKGLKGQEPTQSGSAGNISVPVPAMYNLSFSVSF